MRRERWPWLFPATYVAHFAEEYAADFPRWLAAAAGARLSDQDFVIINAVALVVMTAMVAISASGAVRWPLVALGTVVTINAFLHVAGSFLTASYSPGAVTAVLLWLPLGVFALRRLRPEVPAPVYIAGMGAGAAAHLVVSGLALLG